MLFIHNISHRVLVHGPLRIERQILARHSSCRELCIIGAIRIGVPTGKRVTRFRGIGGHGNALSEFFRDGRNRAAALTIKRQGDVIPIVVQLYNGSAVGCNRELGNRLAVYGGMVKRQSRQFSAQRCRSHNFTGCTGSALHRVFAAQRISGSGCVLRIMLHAVGNSGTGFPLRRKGHIPGSDFHAAIVSLGLESFELNEVIAFQRHNRRIDCAFILCLIGDGHILAAFLLTIGKLNGVAVAGVINFDHSAAVSGNVYLLNRLRCKTGEILRCRSGFSVGGAGHVLCFDQRIVITGEILGIMLHRIPGVISWIPLCIQRQILLPIGPSFRHLRIFRKIKRF